MIKFTLRQKLASLIALILLLAGGTSSYLAYLKSKSTLIDMAEKDLEIMTIDKSQDLSSAIKYFELSVEKLANMEELYQYLQNNKKLLQDKKILNLLEHYHVNEFIENVYVMQQDGVVAASTDERLVNKSYAFRDYFQKAIKGNFTIEASFGITTKSLGYYFSAPIKGSDGNIVGVAVMKVNPEAINQYLKHEVLSTKSDIMIVNDNGVIIHSFKDGRLFHTLGKISEEIKKYEIEKHFPTKSIQPLQYDVIQNVLSSLNGYQKFNFNDEVDKTEEILAINKISGSPFTLVVEEELDDYLSIAVYLSRIIGLFVLISTIFAIAISHVIVGRYLDPLGELNNFAAKVGKGDYKVKMPEKFSSYELNNLAKVFNKMIANVNVARDNIEEKVQLQTSEIEQKQKALMNVLEDVEEEKLTTDLIAKELEKFKLAVDFASDHVIITDNEGIILYANHAAEKITGFKAVDIIGKKAGSKKLWGGMMPQKFYEKLWKTVKIHKKTFTGELTNRRKDGTIYQANASITPVLNKKKEVIFFVGIERDITKEKEVDKMKTEFISLASHQLRTPLSAMKWLSEMLLHEDAGKLTKEQAEFIKQIYDSNQRMINLVNSLLDISKIESGKIVVEPKLTDLKEVVQTVVGEQKDNLKEKEIDLTVTIDKSVKRIKIDSKLISEVYKNLLSNAIKYIEPKGKISIHLYRDKNHIISEVKDNGFGIPKEEQSRIFQKFYRSSNVIKMETDGNGLGLYLVKSIVESSGGKIWFTSKEGKGTTFSFSLPI